MSINKQALREMAERAASDSWGYDRDEFNDAITPEVVLALLDELEAAEKSNVFLKGQLAELTNFNPDWDKLEASYESWCEIAAELLVAKDRIAELEALAGMEAEPVFKINHDSSLIKHVKKVVRETSAPQPLTNSERAELIPVYAATPEPVSVPDERAAFETFMEKRFKDCIDRRLVKNGDGEYFAWDMQVAWIAWKGRAAMLQAEPVSNSDELPLDYLQGHKDGLEWAAQLAEANHPQTGDWLYDDPIDLARAIRKGPDMPTVQGGNSPVIPDDVRRMDWLVSKTVDVREPMVYGSHSLFWSQTITDEEDDYHATKLREQIDAAMAAEQAAAPQQEVKSALEHGMQRYAGAMQKLVEGGD